MIAFVAALLLLLSPAPVLAQRPAPAQPQPGNQPAPPQPAQPNAQPNAQPGAQQPGAQQPGAQPGAQPNAGAANPAAQAGGGKVPNIQQRGDFYVLNFDETGGADALTLEQFVKHCQEVTGFNFTYTQETAATLGRIPLRMYGSKIIPKNDFYPFFQIMMIINEFVCTKIGPEHLAVILIQSTQPQAGRGQGGPRKDALYVFPEDLDKFTDQPAVPITTVVDLPHTNVRDLSNSMRQMFTDPQSQQIIPVGNSNSLIITGFGSNVVSIVKMLRFVDDASGNQETITPQFEVLPLEFASAEELADTISELLDAGKRATQARGAAQANSSGVTAPLQTGQAESKIMVHGPTNSLLVMAMPEDMPRIKELVARLDVDVVQGERTYHIYNLDNVDAEELQKTLDDFIRNASRVSTGAGAAGANRTGGAAATPGAASRNEVVVVADKSTNSLLIAANRTRYDELLQLIQRLDRRQEQVLIETALVELSDQDSFNLSVELGLAELSGAGNGQFGVTSFGLSTFQDTNSDGVPDIRLVTGADGGPPLAGVTAGILKGDNFSLPILINALKTRRDTNVLNVPSVLVNNNKSAKVVSKDEQPTTQITLGGVGNQTQENFKEYVEAGITMEISPTISASHYLRLNCSLEVSNFIGTVSGAIPPPRTTRTIHTTVNVPDGDTMVIGGIITDVKGTERRSVPFLGDIPILGYFFSSNSTSGAKTTLYFFVTPHIMRDRDFADLAEYSYKRKLDAADAIGTSRIRVVDPSFGADKQGVDMRGFEVPLYRGPDRGEVDGAAVGVDPNKLNGMLKEGEKAGTEPKKDGQPQ
jgi:general secretion pathway protein D